MELVDAPAFAPATCCLTSQGGPLIDTGRQVAQFGHAYLHPDIVKDAAAALGLVAVEDYETLLASVERLEARLREFEEGEDSVYVKYEKLQGALAELLQHGVVVDRKGTLRFRSYRKGDRIMED